MAKNRTRRKPQQTPPTKTARFHASIDLLRWAQALAAQRRAELGQRRG